MPDFPENTLYPCKTFPEISGDTLQGCKTFPGIPGGILQHYKGPPVVFGGKLQRCKQKKQPGILPANHYTLKTIRNHIFVIVKPEI